MFFFFQTNIYNSKRIRVSFFVFHINADIEDVTVLVRSLYTGKIELCAKSVEKIIALCKMLQMEEDLKFYEEVVKKELTKQETIASQRELTIVTPIYSVNKRGDSLVLNYLSDVVTEDVVEDPNQHEQSGNDIERSRTDSGNMEQSWGDVKKGFESTSGQVVVLPRVDEIKEEYDENQPAVQSGHMVEMPGVDEIKEEYDENQPRVQSG